MRITLIILFLWVPCCLAAPGDILYQNCMPGSSCTAVSGSIGTYASNTGWTRTVVTDGCYSGSCIKLVGSFNPSPSTPSRWGAGSTSIRTDSILGKNEITVSYWMKVIGNPTGPNIKGTIQYLGNSNERWGTDILPHYTWQYYISRVVGTITPAPWIEMKTSANASGYPIDNGDGTYYSHAGYTEVKVHDGRPIPGRSTWVRITKYFKLPTTPTGKNGAVKVWLNNELMLDFVNASFIDIAPHNPPRFQYMTFMSSSETTSSFEHWMDDMVIYEGYVPPVAAVGPVLSNHQPSSPLPAGTTGTTLAITTGANATCRYSTTPNITYASMQNSFTGAGTTSHTRDITGLANGSSATYYVKCSDGTANNYDYPIAVSVLEPQYILGVAKYGDGTVVSDPAGINCGNTCSQSFNENASVILTATPSSGSTLTSITGCDSVIGNQCTVAMTSNKTIDVTFTGTSVSCDLDHFWLCSDGPCQSIGYNFWDGACRTIAEPTDWTGANIAVNGTFSNWSQTPGGTWMPDNWYSYTQSSISQDLGACSILQGGHIYRPLPEIKNYRYVANMRVFTGDFEVWTGDNGSQFHYSGDGDVRTITGLVSYDGEGDDDIYFKVHGIIDDVVIKELGTSVPINGECGPISGDTVASVNINDPGLCYQGEAANLSETWPKTWDCLGYNGGTPDLGCTAYLLEVERKINVQGAYDFR